MSNDEALKLAFEGGWRAAAEFADRPDIEEYIGSPEYFAAMSAALGYEPVLS